MCPFQVAPAAAATAGPGPQLEELHQRIRNCRRCQDIGLIPTARPVLPGAVVSRVVLVGQAPGRLEEQSALPFSGRAGRELFRWLSEAGLGDEVAARNAVYITSITKCFPGSATAGSGDRRPSPREVALCRPHLDDQLRLLRPRLVIAVGQLAIARFLGCRPMDQLVGRVFWEGGEEQTAGAPVEGSPWGRALVLPLPHPSGASRWLNQPAHRAQLKAALGRLGRLVRTLAGPEVGALDCV
ncbi:MAG: uracil-DNA glycosylase [Candidatus Dormibacteria bacterium]